MIKTTLEQMDHYVSVHPGLKAAFEALRKQAEKPFEAGRIPVSGDELFIQGREYDTKSVVTVKFEAHKKYIDIMLALEGWESISCRSGQISEDMITEYDEEGDCYFASMEIPHSVFLMKPGDVAIFFPNELHAPGVYAEGESEKIKKYVVKVLA